MSCHMAYVPLGNPIQLINDIVGYMRFLKIKGTSISYYLKLALNLDQKHVLL